MSNDWADEKAAELTGECSCHHAYTSRGLVDPQCAFHLFSTELADALRRAEKRGREAMKREAVDAANREAQRFYWQEGNSLPRGDSALLMMAEGASAAAHAIRFLTVEGEP